MELHQILRKSPLLRKFEWISLHLHCALQHGMATQAVMAAVDPLPLDDEKNQNEKFSQAAYYEDITGVATFTDVT